MWYSQLPPLPHRRTCRRHRLRKRHPLRPPRPPNLQPLLRRRLCTIQRPDAPPPHRPLRRRPRRRLLRARVPLQIRLLPDPQRPQLRIRHLHPRPGQRRSRPVTSCASLHTRTAVRPARARGAGASEDPSHGVDGQGRDRVREVHL